MFPRWRRGALERVGERRKRVGRGRERLPKVDVVQLEAGGPGGHFEVLVALDALDQGAVDPDLELLAASAADLDRRANLV